MADLHQLSGMDSGMLFVETAATPNHIAPLMICDPSTVPGGGKLRLKAIKAKLEQALDEAPAFRRKLLRTPLDIDEPYWVDDPTFDVDFHMRHLALPEPGDHRQLAIQVARLLSRPLDSTRPLWEIYVIEGLDRVQNLPPGAFAVLFKIHHAMIDGMGAIALMSGLLDNSPTLPVETRSSWRPEPGPRPTEILARSWLHSMMRPSQMARRFGGLVPALVRQHQATADQEPPIKSGRMAPRTPLNGEITPSRVYDWREYPLAEIKAMRTLVPGATVNDVALAICTGALQRYLRGKNALPDTNLICAVPVSLRTEATVDKPAGNEITIITLPLPTTVEDPTERLRLISLHMSQMKDASRAMSARALAELTSLIPGTFGGMMSRAMSAIGNRTSRSLFANTFVTNTPGFTEPMYFCGARVVNMFGGGPVMNNMGLAHLVGSYGDIFNFNAVGCRDLLPDIDRYMACIEESVEEYRGLLGGAADETQAADQPGGRTKSPPRRRAAASPGRKTSQPART